MKNKLNKVQAYIDALSLKERALLLIATLTCVGYGWNMFLLEPMLAERQQLEAARTNNFQEIAKFKELSAGLLINSQTDPDAENRSRLVELKSKIHASQSELNRSTAHLITPGQMAKAIESVLLQTGGLTFEGLHGLGAEPLLQIATPANAKADPNSDHGAAPDTDRNADPSADPGASSGGIKGAYRHGMRIDFSGNFRHTLAYVKALEALRWGFFWERIDFTVGEHPEARGHIILYTLSLNPGWIGT